MNAIWAEVSDGGVEDTMGDIIAKHERAAKHDLPGPSEAVQYSIRERLGGLFASTSWPASMMLAWLSFWPVNDSGIYLATLY